MKKNDDFKYSYGLNAQLYISSSTDFKRNSNSYKFAKGLQIDAKLSQWGGKIIRHPEVTQYFAMVGKELGDNAMK